MDYPQGVGSSAKGFSSAEELLKSQTVGLVHLSDFRKRRAEAIEITEAQDKWAHKKLAGGTTASGAGASGRGAEGKPTKKRKKAAAGKAKLSFDIEDLEEEEEPKETPSTKNEECDPKAEDRTSREQSVGTVITDASDGNSPQQTKRRLGPNTTVAPPRVMTKWGLAKEAQERERLRREFLHIQERVKATEIVIPFVFFDGSVQPGGRCVMKKGDNVWLFLDKARKMAAEMGVGGEKRRKEWARVGIDDLMVVRGDIILPHHYEFYYFMLNKSVGFHGRIFDMSSQPTEFTPDSAAGDITRTSDLSKYDPLAGPDGNRKMKTIIDQLEGAQDEPKVTKVVDRRWYDRNKHLFPASQWEEFDPNTDYSKKLRTDSQGNSFFRSVR